MEVITKNTQKTIPINDEYSIDTVISNSWSKIAPLWPLKNLIAVNPISGFENLSFEEALREAKSYFQQQEMPEGMQNVNRESIKWLQAFFDEGQSTIQMPYRHLGLLKSALLLFRFDKQLHKNDHKKCQWINNLSQKPEKIIDETLFFLDIAPQEKEHFLTLMLTTLAGWAAHVKYRTNWADAQDSIHPHPVTQEEYLAFRLVLTYLIWPEAKDIIVYHRKALKQSDVTAFYADVTANEALYQRNLIKQLEDLKPPKEVGRAKAQLIFCMDVRSEPFRRALEAQGDYETYGYAGFFGVPVSIENYVTGEVHASCPVLLKPEYNVIEHPSCSHKSYNGYKKLKGIKKIYQSLKYTFVTPFSLVETIGIAVGLWMGFKSLTPRGSYAIQSALKKSIFLDYTLSSDIKTIPFEQQVSYGAGALKIMGLTENFAPLVVFCAHGSTTQNNAYATALDCGACGGRHGAPNARIIAAILNSKNVRDVLKKQKIEISETTLFLAAEHNTTTDEVEIYTDKTSESYAEQIEFLKRDLKSSRNENSFWRSKEMGIRTDIKKYHRATALRAKDWAQVFPEWGLAKNASFIVGPRWLTKDTNLEGRSFLHSYDWRKDPDGNSLATILKAPMVVAQWINAQYFFSTLDNVAYGGGSKITTNITGKIGIMQGNASDLMQGLPLQSVFKSDDEPYHQAIRLTVVVYAPQSYIDLIIKKHKILQKLFKNGWVHLICYSPHSDIKLKLQRDLTWHNLNKAI